MNAETYSDLERKSSASLNEIFNAEEKAFGPRVVERTTLQEASEVIHEELAALRAQGRVLIFSEEEERLIASFRRFKATCKPGNVFKWQTRPAEGIIEPPTPALVRDPQEVSE